MKNQSRERPPRPSYDHMRTLLRRYGLRATRQRLGLAELLFGNGNRHVTADVLAAEAREAGIPASLATVYNVLHLFADVGLVRSFTVENGKTIFDTNTTDHYHCYYETTGYVTDIEVENLNLADQFKVPAGYEVAKVDVVVRLRPRQGGQPTVEARAADRRKRVLPTENLTR